MPLRDADLLLTLPSQISSSSRRRSSNSGEPLFDASALPLDCRTFAFILLYSGKLHYHEGRYVEGLLFADEALLLQKRRNLAAGRTPQAEAGCASLLLLRARLFAQLSLPASGSALPLDVAAAALATDVSSGFKTKLSEEKKQERRKRFSFSSLPDAGGRARGAVYSTVGDLLSEAVRCAERARELFLAQNDAAKLAKCELLLAESCLSHLMHGELLSAAADRGLSPRAPLGALLMQVSVRDEEDEDDEDEDEAAAQARPTPSITLFSEWCRPLQAVEASAAAALEHFATAFDAVGMMRGLLCMAELRLLQAEPEGEWEKATRKPLSLPGLTASSFEVLGFEEIPEPAETEGRGQTGPSSLPFSPSLPLKPPPSGATAYWHECRRLFERLFTDGARVVLSASAHCSLIASLLRVLQRLLLFAAARAGREGADASSWLLAPHRVLCEWVLALERDYISSVKRLQPSRRQKGSGRAEKDRSSGRPRRRSGSFKRPGSQQRLATSSSLKDLERAEASTGQHRMATEEVREEERKGGRAKRTSLTKRGIRPQPVPSDASAQDDHTALLRSSVAASVREKSRHQGLATGSLPLWVATQDLSSARRPL